VGWKELIEGCVSYSSSWWVQKIDVVALTRIENNNLKNKQEKKINSKRQ